MKPIRYILQSYFQQSFTQVMMIIISLIFLIVGSLHTIYSHNADDTVRSYFLLASAVLIIGVVTIYLKEVTTSDASALIPGFRKKQLVAAGILLSPYIIVPTIVFAAKGMPVLSMLAMILLIMSLLSLSTGENPQSKLPLLMVIPLWLVYELLDIEPNLKFIGSFSQLTGLGSNTLFALFIIGVSLVLAYKFTVRLLRGENKDVKGSEFSRVDVFMAGYERLDFISAKLVYRKMSRLIGELKNRRHTYSGLIRLYQFALFNPSSTLFLDISFVSGGFLYLAIYFMAVRGDTFNTVLEVTPLLFMLYQMMAIGLTTEFLQHRDRLPSLWLQSRLASRREVSLAITLTYLLVAGRQYLKITLMLLLLPLFVPSYRFPEYLVALAICVLPYILLIALSLRLSDEITSVSCWGWSVFNLVMAILVFFINAGICLHLDSSFGYFVTFLVLIVASILYLWRTFSTWADTEMNFIGPEFSM